MRTAMLSLAIVAAAAATSARADTVLDFYGPDDALTHSVSVTTASTLAFGETGVTLDNLAVPYGQLLRVAFRADATTGVAAPAADADAVALRVSPNPVADQMRVSGAGEGDLTVFDATGRLVLARRGYKGESIDASRLSPGLYIVAIGGRALKFTKK